MHLKTILLLLVCSLVMLSTANAQSEPCVLEVVADGVDPTCGAGLDNGSIILTINNGVPFYFITWSNGGQGLSQYFLSVGTYCYTVTDGSGCSANGCVTLNPPVCGAPQNATATGITNTQATITWTGSSCAKKYRVQYRKQGASDWLMVNSNASLRVLNNLESGTVYQCRVRSVCSTDGSVLSPFSSLFTFSTAGCKAPEAPTVTNLSASEAKISWGIISGVSKYRVLYREAGTTSWMLKIVVHPQNSVILSNLNASTTYEYQMVTVCTDASNLSNYTPIDTFTTNALRLNEISSTDVILYPNPTSGIITINWNNEQSEMVQLEVYDMLGRQVSSEWTLLNQGSTLLRRDYADLPKGNYLIRFKSNTSEYKLRFTKQ